MSLRKSLALLIAGRDYSVILTDDIRQIKADLIRTRTNLEEARRKIDESPTREAEISAHVNRKLAQEEKLKNVTPWTTRQQTAEIVAQVNAHNSKLEG